MHFLVIIYQVSVFPESLKTIGNDAFFSNNLSNISFSEGLKIIGNGAFYNCKFSSIELPDTVTDIGESAFTGIVIFSQ